MGLPGGQSVEQGECHGVSLWLDFSWLELPVGLVGGLPVGLVVVNGSSCWTLSGTVGNAVGLACGWTFHGWNFQWGL